MDVFGTKVQIVLWIAVAAFIFGTLFELWLRVKNIKKKELEKHHSKRIHLALDHFRKHNIKKITNDLWQEITDVSHSTAYRDLNKLEEMGVLEKHGRGRGVYYTPVKKNSASPGDK